MDKYTRGQINEMRDKMKYLTDYDISKTPEDNKILNEDIIDRKLSNIYIYISKSKGIRPNQISDFFI